MDEMDVLLKHAFLKTKDEWKGSNEGREKVLLHVSVNRKHTELGKRILVYQICVAVLVFIILPASVFAASKAVSVLKEKVEDTNYTNEQIEELYSELKNQGYSDEAIGLLTSLRTNEYGLTYGPLCMGADLIMVESDEGVDGYVYRDDFLYYQPDFKTPEEALKWQEEFYDNYPDGIKIPVYKSNGKDKIGTFTVHP